MNNYIDLQSARSSNCPLLRGTLEYLESFLSKPHSILSDAGYFGTVCPFTSKVLEHETVCFTNEIIDVSDRNAIVKIKDSLLEDHLRHFIDVWEPSKQKLACLLVMVFGPQSAEDCNTFISKVQKDLQPRFVERGILLSELHPHSQVPSVRCPVFFPSRPPFPLFFVRRIIPNDIPYLLRKDRYDEETYNKIARSLNRDFGKSAIEKEMKRLNLTL